MSKLKEIEEIDLTVDSDIDHCSDFFDDESDEDGEEDDDSSSAESDPAEEQTAVGHPPRMNVESNNLGSKDCSRSSSLNLASENAIHRWTGKPEEPREAKIVVRSDDPSGFSTSAEPGSPRSITICDSGNDVDDVTEPAIGGADTRPPPSQPEPTIVSGDEVSVVSSAQLRVIRSATTSPASVEERVKRPRLVQFPCTSSAAELRSAPDVWRDLNEQERARKPESSREVLEAQVTALHNRGIAAMRRGHSWTAIDCFQRIFVHSAVRELCPTDWSTFDWMAAKEKWSECSRGKRLADMPAVLLSTSMAMVELAENPIPYYLQALSIRPDATELWFELGECSTKRGHWRVAQFAFEQCSNQFRALEALLILHFVQRDYKKCLPVLRKVLDQCPDNLIANVVREELKSDPSSPWNKILERYPVCPATVDVEGTRQRVMNKIDAIRRGAIDHSADPTVDFKNPLIVESANASAASYQPLTLRIESSDMSIAGLSRRLCNVFDRVDEFSSFARQQVAFECAPTLIDRDSRPNSMYGASHGALLGVASSEFELSPGMKAQLAARRTRMEVVGGVDDERVVRHLMEELLRICDVSHTDSPSALQLEIGVGDRGRHCKRPITAVGKKPAEGSEPAKKRKLELGETDDTLLRRRSTRFLENVDDYTAATTTAGPTQTVELQSAEEQPNGVEHEWELHQIVQAEKGGGVVPQYTPLLPPTRQQSPPAVTDGMASEAATGELVTRLTRSLVDAGKSSVDALVYEFLRCVTTRPHALNAPGRDDLDAVRQLYLRWVDVAPALCGDRGDLVDQLAIHVAAAELGSSRALSVLHHYFPSVPPAEDDKSAEEGMEEPIVVASGGGLSTEQAVPSCAKLCRVEIKSTRKRDRFAKEKGTCLSERALDALFGTTTNHASQMHSDPEPAVKSGAESAIKAAFPMEGVNEEMPSGRTRNESSETPRVCRRRLNLESAEKYPSRRLEVRYRCLQSTSDAPLQLRKQCLKLALTAIGEGESFLAYERDGGTVGIGKGHVERELERLDESAHARQLKVLRENGDFEELESLLNKYNWHTATEVDQIEHMFLLCECASKTGRPQTAFEWWLRAVQLVRDRKSIDNRSAKAFLKRCVAMAEELLASYVLPDVQMVLASGLLADLVIAPPFQKSISLWTLLYEMVRQVEGELTERTLKSYYASAEGVSGRMPCRSLMVLVRAHRAIGEAEKCHRKGGRFLRVYLDELYKVVSGQWFAKLCLGDADGQYEDVLTNVAEEVYQIICCAFTDQQWNGREEYAKHWSHLKWRADWPMALKIVALLMPRELPELYAPEYDVDARFVDVVNAILPFVLRVGEEEQRRFSDFLTRRPVCLWPCTAATAGGSGGLSALELFNLATREMAGEDPRGDLLTFADGINEERQRTLTTQARVLYALTCWYYVNGGPSEEEQLRCASSCLAICAPFLDDELQSAVWLVYGRVLTKRYSRLGDSGLLARAEQWLFPFKVSVLLKHDFSEVHLDLAALIYQIRTRLRRYSSRCRMHCELAILFNSVAEGEDWLGSVDWVSYYLMAKIAEKIDEPVAEVMRLYHLSAISLEREGHKYPSRINKERQEHFEPLEIHYKVHSHALKKARATPVQGVEQARATLMEIEGHLRRFAHHGVAITVDGKSAPEFYRDVDAQPPPRNNCSRPGDEGVLENMLEIVETRENIVAMCRKAFELIVAKFPHYKSIYRLAEEAYLDGDCPKAWKTLLEAFYGGARKRSVQTPLSAENIIEIRRSDIERSGSLCYHTVKIMRLAAATAFKCREWERLVQLTAGLLPLRNETNESEKLSDDDVRRMRRDCVEKITLLVSEPTGKSELKEIAHVIELLQSLMKKLRKEGYHDDAAALTPCLGEWTRRRDHLRETPTTQHDNNCTPPKVDMGSSVGEPTKRPVPPSSTPVNCATGSNPVQTPDTVGLNREFTALVLGLKSLPQNEQNEFLNKLREHRPDYLKRFEDFAAIYIRTLNSLTPAPPTSTIAPSIEGATNSAAADANLAPVGNVQAPQKAITVQTSTNRSGHTACVSAGTAIVPATPSSIFPANPQATTGSATYPISSRSPAPSKESTVGRCPFTSVLPSQHPAKLQHSTASDRVPCSITPSTVWQHGSAEAYPTPSPKSHTRRQTPHRAPMEPTQVFHASVNSTPRSSIMPGNWTSRQSAGSVPKRLSTHPTPSTPLGASSTTSGFENRVSFLSIDGQPSPAKRIKQTKQNASQNRARDALSAEGPVPQIIIIDDDASPTKNLTPLTSSRGHSPTYQDILKRMGVSQLGDAGVSGSTTTPQKSDRRLGSTKASPSTKGGASPLQPALLSPNAGHQSGVLQAQLDHIERRRKFSDPQFQLQPSSSAHSGVGPRDMQTPLVAQKSPIDSHTVGSYAANMLAFVSQQGWPTTPLQATDASTTSRGTDSGRPQTDISRHRFTPDTPRPQFNQK